MWENSYTNDIKARKGCDCISILVGNSVASIIGVRVEGFFLATSTLLVLVLRIERKKERKS